MTGRVAQRVPLHCYGQRMASIFQRVRSWWSKDDLAEAEEETRMTEREREVVDEGYEGRKDDLEAQRGGTGTIPSNELGTDFEADSRPPR